MLKAAGLISYVIVVIKVLFREGCGDRCVLFLFSC